MNDFKLAFLEVLILLVLVGLILPALFSAKSTSLVFLGIGIIVSVLMYVLGFFKVESYIVKLIKKDLL